MQIYLELISKLNWYSRNYDIIYLKTTSHSDFIALNERKSSDSNDISVEHIHHLDSSNIFTIALWSNVMTVNDYLPSLSMQ